jgi:excisionase family DNA binding protein
MSGRTTSVPDVPIPARTVGAFYVVQLSPDVAPQRVKFGWAINPTSRLLAHRCAAPTARLIRSWPCVLQWEHRAIGEISSVGCRRVSNEVFDADDVDALVSRAEAFFAGHSAVEPPPRAKAARWVTTAPAVRPSPPKLRDAEWFTVEEVAGHLQVREQTVGRWLRDGLLSGRNFGVQAGYRLRASELNRFLQIDEQPAP